MSTRILQVLHTSDLQNSSRHTVVGVVILIIKFLLQPKDGSNHMDIVRRCCAIKPMTAWHLNKTVTTCRERCGGQGYLSINRFGTIFASAHAGRLSTRD